MTMNLNVFHANQAHNSTEGMKGDSYDPASDHGLRTST